MLKVAYNFKHATNVQGILLSAILLVSVFGVVAPVAFNSLGGVGGVTPNAVQKISRDVVEALQNTAAEQLNVIVQVTDKAEVAALIEVLGGQVSMVYESVDALAASIPASSLLQLASDSRVTRIYKDAIKELCYKGAITENLKYTIPRDPATGEPVLAGELEGVDVEPIAIEDIASVEPGIYTNAELTGASGVWSETAGAGSVVVIIDTGVWSDSPPACWKCDWRN
ncbi:MAG: hypothetical protein QW667_04795 [Candidatus Bathyarchaeia archaeon]